MVAPVSLNKILVCQIPLQVIKQLDSQDGSLQERLNSALKIGLSVEVSTLPDNGRFSYKRRWLSCPPDVYVRVLEIAEEFFNGETERAAGWLINLGLGLDTPPQIPVGSLECPLIEKARIILDNPPKDQLRPAISAAKRELTKVAPKMLRPKIPTDIIETYQLCESERPQRRSPRPPVPKQVEDVAPLDHVELRKRRIALGLFQYDVAEACGFSRTTVSAVERGERTGIGTRKRITQVLTYLESQRQTMA